MPRTLVAILLWSLLLAAVVASAGCFNEVVGVLAAPQAVAAGAAADVGNAAGQAVATAGLSDPDRYNQTISDLDRIIAENPDASNRDDLLRLKNDLIDQKSALGSSHPATLIPKTSEFERRDESPKTGGLLLTRNADERNSDQPVNEFGRTSAGGDDEWKNFGMLTTTNRAERHLRQDPPQTIGGMAVERHAEPKPFVSPRTSNLDEWRQYYYDFPAYQRW